MCSRVGERFCSACTKRCCSWYNSDYKDDGTNVLLDANENAYGPGLALENGCLAEEGPGPAIDLLGLNRYPDPCVSQHDVKA